MPVPVVIDNSGANTTAGRVTRQNFPLTTDIVLVTSANQANIVGGVLPMTIEEYAKNSAAFYFDFMQSANPIYPTGLTTTTTIDADGTFVNSAGLVTQKTTDVWPLDYDPSTLSALGRPVWEARTNLLIQSAALNTGWTLVNLRAFGSGSVVDAAISPDGTQNADQITEDSATGAHRIGRTITLAANTTAVYSFYVKRAVGTRQFGIVASAGADFMGSLFNLDTVAVGASIDSGAGAVFTSASIESVGNGWFRCSVVGIASTTTANPIVYAEMANVSTAGGDSYAGDNASALYVWGAQAEAGAFLTPYIPTTTASVTRAADACSIALPSGFNATEGTFVFEGIPFQVAQAATGVSFTDGTANEYMQMRSSPSLWTLNVVDGGVSQVAESNAAVTANVMQRIAVAYKANDFAISARGTAPTLDTSGTLPTVTTIYLGALNASVYFNGWLRKLYYFSTAFDPRNLQRAST